MTHNYSSKADQYVHEYHAWTRMLEFYKLESAFLKTRLSEVVDRVTGKDFLVLAEHYQNQFIIKDDFISELKHDINEMEAKVDEDAAFPSFKQESKQNKLRNEMEYLEKSFSQLKNEFNKYLLSTI